MPPLSVMVKPASSSCNMRCEYCFYKDVSDEREITNFGIMKKETAERLIKTTLDFAGGYPVAFAFQGGEPLIAGLDFFKFFLNTVNKNNNKNSDIFYSVQTNGTLINDVFAKFFSENGFLVGLSLDGDEKLNKFRKLEDGSNSFDEITKAAAILKRNRTDFNILATLTGYLAENGETAYKFFRSCGFKFLQFTPCVRPFGSAERSDKYMTAEQFGDFLIKVFNLYVKDYVRGNYISVRQFDNWVRLYLKQQPEQCGMNGHCSHQFVAEANGNIYPCDFYCTDKYQLGDVMSSSLETMANSEKAVNFLKESLVIPDKCRKCEYYYICRAGGCKRTKASEDYCGAYKLFFSSCLPLFRVFANEKPRRQTVK